MSKEAKNTIALIFMFVLIIAMALTIYFGKGNKTNNNGVMGNNPPIMEKGNLPNDRDFRERDDIRDRMPNKNTKEEDSKLEETSATTASDEAGSLTNRLPQGNMPNMPGNFSVPQEAKTNDFNVMLLTIESFFLGATIMFLIMNNINNKETIRYVEVVKEKENKKEKKDI